MSISHQADNSRPIVPDVTGKSNAEAALAYAEAGICITPVRLGTKNPGSYIGPGWPERATCDLDTVRSWWLRWPEAGIAMHPGPSGYLVIDVDHPEKLEDWLRNLLKDALSRSTTNNPTSERKHHFFRLKPDQHFGCGLGGMKPAKGEGFGDIKCFGGAIILGPTVHPRKREDGQYHTGPGGTAPFLPEEISNRLTSIADPSVFRSLTPTELDAAAKTFLGHYRDARDPVALNAILADFDPEPGARHLSIFETLCWAFREAKAGCFEAQIAHDQLKAMWEDAIGGPNRNGDGGEWNRMVRDAVYAADNSGTVEELWARAHRNEWPSDRAPLRVAEQYDRRTRATGRPVAFWGQSWFRWQGQRWQMVSENEFRAELYSLLGKAFYNNAKDERIPWNPDRNKIDKVLDALKSVVSLGDSVRPQTWLDGTTDNVISCANGLLRVSDRKLLAHTPNFFNTLALGFDYKDDAPKPKRWLKFLAEVLNDDSEAIAVLQEWFGYVLSGRTDLQKMLMLVGPTRCGKGTIDKVLTALVGAENHVGLSGHDLSDGFGMAGLIGKTVAVFSDERMTMNGKRFVETLLRITGEDVVTVKQKYKSDWTGQLSVRFMFMSNEMPTLPDNSGAIVGRIIPLELPNSWLGKEDLTLLDTLRTELPAILNWSLDGLDRLNRNGRFTEVTGSAALTGMLNESSSPIKRFVDEMCVLRVGKSIAKARLFDVWRDWCRDNGYEAGSRENLTKKLLAAFGRNVINPDLRVGGSGQQVRHYGGITLRPAGVVSRSGVDSPTLRVVKEAGSIVDE
jgi:P4 family phage/plasmid primase-like protien